jgi:hypothetical protein
MATKEQLARLNADNPTTIVERLSGNYIYPGAISPMRTPPIEQEAGREIVRLRTEIDALKDEVELKGIAINSMRESYGNEIDRLKAENERLRKDAERGIWARLHPDRMEKICMLHEWRGSTYVAWRPKPEDIDSMTDAAMKDFSTQPKEEERN